MFCFASTANATRAPETRAAGCANAATAFLKPRPAALGAARESEEKALTSAIVCVQSARSPATGAAFTRDAGRDSCYLSDRKGDSSRGKDPSVEDSR